MSRQQISNKDMVTLNSVWDPDMFNADPQCIACFQALNEV